MLLSHKISTYLKYELFWEHAFKKICPIIWETICWNAKKKLMYPSQNHKFTLELLVYSTYN